MDSMQHIILDNTLQRIGDEQYEGYICHGYCYGGECTFERNNKHFKMQAGDCIIISRRGDLVGNLRESADLPNELRLRETQAQASGAPLSSRCLDERH